MTITAAQIVKLESEGWTVEQVSPLKLQHADTDSIATGLAASIVVRSYFPAEVKLTMRPQDELVLLHLRIKRIVDAAFEVSRADEDYWWKEEYDQIFADDCSVRVRELLQELDTSLDYWSDGSYQDDILAFFRELESVMSRMRTEGKLN